MTKDDVRLLDRCSRTSTQHKRSNFALHLAVKVLVSTLCLMTASCRMHFSHPKNYDKWKDNTWGNANRAFRGWGEMKHFAREMDKVSRELEEWGTLGISAPVLIRNRKQFEFDPKVTAVDLYKENRTEGAVSLRVATGVNVGISIDTKKLVENIIGNLAAVEETDDPGEQLTLKTQIVGAMRKLAGSTEGQAAITGLVSGRPELVGLINSVLGVASVEKDDDSAAKEGGDGGADDELETGDDADVMESTPTESLSEETSESANAAAKAVGEFSEMLGKFDSSKLTGINPNRRGRWAASAFWELNLHKFFSMPEHLIGNFKPVFATFTVSCQPGWRTRKGFAGVVDVRVEYMYTNDEGASIPLSDHPTGRSILPVAGIYPAYDSQELNLRNSQRDLQTFAAQLAASGELAAAKVFLEAAEKREQDAETNTGIATVTGYSNGSHGFGYEFRPTFRALEQPGSPKTKPGFRLEPISFPAVAIALIDVDRLPSEIERMVKLRMDESVRARLGKDKSLIDDVVDDAELQIREEIEQEVLERMLSELEAQGKAAFQALTQEERQQKIDQRELNDRIDRYYGSEQCHARVDKRAAELADEMVDEEVGNAVRRTELVFHITHTWRPLNPPLAANIPLLHHLGRLFQSRLSEHDFVERLRALGAAYLHFDKTFCRNYDYEKGVFSNRLGNQYACETLRRRWLMLASQAVNFESRYKLNASDLEPSPSKNPTIKSVSPTVGWRNAPTVIVIQGTNFGEWEKDKEGKPVLGSKGERKLEDWVKRVLIGGVRRDDSKECKASKTFKTIGPTTVVATVPAGCFHRSDLKHDVTVVTKHGSATVRKAIQFVTKKKDATGEPAITVTRDGDGRITVITINADAIEEGKDDNLLKAIRAILENENCCDDVKCTAKKSGT